ncbi:MAG TPA: hypothetical protein VK968_00860 [Roseimicrobium sp.]|nr:hypothetical protein [Roseimicrobium sp.]
MDTFSASLGSKSEALGDVNEREGGGESAGGEAQPATDRPQIKLALASNAK